jgi:hypothetical protein
MEIKIQNTKRFRKLLYLFSTTTCLTFLLVFINNNNGRPKELIKNRKQCYSFDSEGIISGVLHFGTLRLDDFERKLWYIKLDSPICVNSIDTNYLPRKIESDSVWLNVLKSQYKEYEMLNNNNVKINGKIYHGIIRDKLTGRNKMAMIECQVISVMKVSENQKENYYKKMND